MRPGLLKGEWEQGGLYTGPSPLGDSPAVILCLDEPFTPPPTPSPYSGHNPLPSIAPSTIFSSSGGAQPIPRQKLLPQTRGPEESLAPLVSTEKPPSSLSYARPCPRTPRPVDAHSPASHRKEEL